MRTSADQNLSFHYGGDFPPSFSNQNVVSFQPAAMSNAAGLISEGMHASDGVSSIGGMILPGNPVTQSNTSSVISLPGNLSGNIILDPLPPLKLSPAATANWSLEELCVEARPYRGTFNIFPQGNGTKALKDYLLQEGWC